MKLIMMKKLFLALFLVVLIIVSGATYAEPINQQRTGNEYELVPQVKFDSLSESQQQVLAPMREKWTTLSATQQQRLIKGAKRWAGMSEEQRTKARAKMQRWISLSPEKRQKLLKRLERYQAMSPQQRQRLRKTFRKFRQLPEEQRESLRARWRRAGAAERQKMRQELMNRPHPEGMGDGNVAPE